MLISPPACLALGTGHPVVQSPGTDLPCEARSADIEQVHIQTHMQGLCGGSAGEGETSFIGGSDIGAEN